MGMIEFAILAVAALGLVAPLLPGWRRVAVAVAVFAACDAVLLVEVSRMLAATPEPGPVGRGVVVLFYLPTAVFALACAVRLAFIAGRSVWRRARGP